MKLIDGEKTQVILARIAQNLLECDNPAMAGAVAYAADVIDKQRAVDAAPIVHARWARPSEYGMGHKFNNLGLVCSACVSWTHNPYNYCSHCGAKMDGGEENVAEM